MITSKKVGKDKKKDKDKKGKKGSSDAVVDDEQEGPEAMDDADDDDGSESVSSVSSSSSSSDTELKKLKKKSGAQKKLLEEEVTLNNLAGWFLSKDATDERRTKLKEKKLKKRFKEQDKKLVATADEIKSDMKKEVSSMKDGLKDELKTELKEELLKELKGSPPSFASMSTVGSYGGGPGAVGGFDVGQMDAIKASACRANAKIRWGPLYDESTGERPVVYIGGFDSGSTKQYVANTLDRIFAIAVQQDARLMENAEMKSVMDRARAHAQKEEWKNLVWHVWGDYTGSIMLHVGDMGLARWLKASFMKASDAQRRLAQNAKGETLVVWAQIDGVEEVRDRRKLFGQAVRAVEKFFVNAGLQTINKLDVKAAQRKVMWKPPDSSVGATLIFCRRADPVPEIKYAEIKAVVEGATQKSLDAKEVEAEVQKLLLEEKRSRP